VTGNDVVVLLRARSRFEADATVALLTAHGLRAYAAHRQLEDVFPTLFSREGTAVMVRADELEQARALLDAPSDDLAD
jgi:hypothetical protein